MATSRGGRSKCGCGVVQRADGYSGTARGGSFRFRCLKRSRCSGAFAWHGRSCRAFSMHCPDLWDFFAAFFADNLCVFIRFRTHKGTRTYLFCYPANLQSTFALLALVPVRSFEIVDPRNVNALRFHNKNELTLITCYPFSYIGPAPKRFIVHAEPVRAPEKCSQS